MAALPPSLIRSFETAVALSAQGASGSVASRTAMHDRNPLVWPCDCLAMPTDALAKRNPFPQDKRIRFVESTHKYYIDGVEAVTSVTSMAHAPFPHFDTKERAEASVGNHKYAGLTALEIAQQWSDSGERASSLGTTMHAAIEVALNTNYWSTDHRIQPELAMARAFFNTEVAGRGLEVFRTEPTIFGPLGDSGLVLPGSVDCLCRDPNTGELWIFDWKRVEKLYVSVAGRFGWGEGPFNRLENIKYAQYSLQLHIYRHILVNHYGFSIHPDNLYMVALHPANTGYRMLRALDVSDLVATELMGSNFAAHLETIRHHKACDAASEAWKHQGT